MFNSKELSAIYRIMSRSMKELTEEEKDVYYKVESAIRNTPDDDEENGWYNRLYDYLGANVRVDKFGWIYLKNENELEECIYYVDEAEQHEGHDLVLVQYGQQNISIECLTCNEVLCDSETMDEDEL